MGLAGLIVMGGVLALLAVDQRARLFEEVRRETQSTAFFLADHAGRLFEVADVALRSAATNTEGLEWDAIEHSETLWRQLRALRSTLPYIEDVWLNDPSGRLRLTTFAYPTPASNASDRDAFRVHRQPNDRLHVGQLITGRVTTTPSFLVSRRLDERDGSFRGVVSVTANLAYFGDYWRRAALPFDARISLIRAEDASVLAQEPAPAAGSAFIPIDAEAFRRAIALDPRGGSYESNPAGDGPRLGADQRVGDLPLYLRVSVSRAAVNRAWLGRLVPYGLFAAAAGLALLLLTVLAFRQARREARATRDLEHRVTERTAALGQVAEEMRLIVEGARDTVILTIDSDGCLTTWSQGAEAILGWTAQEAVGQPTALVFTPEDQEAGIPQGEIDTARRRGVAPDERWHARKDGGRVYLNGTLRPLTDAAGRERGFLKVAHDDTERRRSADALRRLNETLERRVAERTQDLEAANRRLEHEAAERQEAEARLRQMQKMEAVGQLTGGIAHDFNNMLAVVISGLTLMQKRIARGETGDLRRFVDAAMDGAVRAAELTRRLLAFSRQQPLAPEILDVNRLVGGMSELLRRTLGEDVRLETVLAGGLWRVHADAGQLENALLNLAVNARDAMLAPGGGRLTIETANAHLDEAYAREHGGDVVSGQYVLVAVTDTGSGMPPQVVAKAFDPFFTTKPVGKGTGLGLSQVFGFVKQSGGHVKIYSEPSEGTTIKVYLPRHRDDLATTIAHGAAEGPATSASGCSASGALPRGEPREILLVVEDEERVREMAVASLRELGYTVLHAASAPEALSVIDAHPELSLLFTDIVMPEVNGRKLADEAVRRRPDLKVLFTTGFSRNAVVHNGVLDPGVNFLAKPYTLQQLAAKVRQVLDATT